MEPSGKSHKTIIKFEINSVNTFAVQVLTLVNVICDPILENHTSGHIGQFFFFYSYNEALSGYLPCVKIL